LASLFEFIRLYESLAYSEKNHVLNTTESAREYFKNFYSDKQDREYFSAAYLDINGGVIKSKVMSSGDMTEAPIYPREILKEALFSNCNSVIISHNHPGRTARMSSADMEVTQEIIKRLNAADITLDDHILVAGQRAFSLAESGACLGEKNNNFRVSETDTPRLAPGKAKTSAREQLMSDKAAIAKEQAGPMKQPVVAKKSAGLEI